MAATSSRTSFASAEQLAWVLGWAGVDTAPIGVSRVEQVHDNIASTELKLAPEHQAALDAVSKPATALLCSLFKPEVSRHIVFGGSSVQARRP